MKKNTIKKVLNYLRPYKLKIMATIFLALVIVVLTLYVPIIIGRVIDELAYKKVDFKQIYNQLFVILGVVGITSVCQWIMNRINNKMTYNIVRNLREDAFNKIQRLPISYLDTQSKGDLVSRVITDAEQFGDGLLLGFTQLFSGILTIVCTLIFMMSLNVGIALVVMIVTPLSLGVAHIIATKTYFMFKKQAQTRGEQIAYIDEIIGNEKLVKAYGYEEEAIAKFDKINVELGEYSLKAIFFSSITNPATRFVNAIVYAGVALTGGIAILNGGMTVGIWSCFLSYANQYTKPFNEISGFLAEFQNALACISRIFTLLETEEEIDDIIQDENNENIDNKYENNYSTSSENINSKDGKVDIRNVYFSYNKDKLLIENLSLEVEAGSKVAIVGPTGCGKTTLINLLMRFYEVDSGDILIDNISIRNMTRDKLRSKYGMVLQETWLKQGTIKQNLTLGNKSASDEEVIKAAKLTYAHDFIKRLPNGYDTEIGEEGGTLSQGQKQLLCITRTMIAKPCMLILDEATSSIDTRTEQKIQKAFNILMEGKTTFIVAHRLSTIENADCILVMKDGKVIEQGNHRQLIGRKGFYYELYNSQFSKA